MRVEPLPFTPAFSLPQEEPFVPSTPILPSLEELTVTSSPTYNSAILSLIGTLEAIHTTGAEIHTTQTKELTRLSKHLEKSQAAELEKMREISEKSQASGVWHVLQTIGSYLLAGLNFVFGGLLTAQGAPIIGGIMIAAGLISVANLAFSDCGFWSWIAKQIAKEDKELAQKLETIIPAIIGLLAAAASAVGTYQVWQMAGQFDILRQVLLVLQTTVGVMEGVTTIGKGFSDYDVKKSQEEATKFQSDSAKFEHALERTTRDMENHMKIPSSCTASLARMIRSTIYSNQKTANI